MDFLAGLVGAFVGATASIGAVFLAARSAREQELRVHHRTEFLSLAAVVLESAQQLVGALGNPQNTQEISEAWNGMVLPIRRVRLYAPTSMLDPLARLRASHEGIASVLRGQLAATNAGQVVNQFGDSLSEFEDAVNSWADAKIRTVAG